MIKNLKIIAVSYLNTLPFIHGIKHSGILENTELILDYPAMCVKNAMEGKGDIALVPVASLQQLKFAKIISDYCLGSENRVDSVCLLSQKPLKEITAISLDFHSRTSVKLIKVLARDFWKKENIAWSDTSEDKDQPESVLLIGDKVFEHRDKYKYNYDLVKEWKQYTGLPFVFAAWVQLNPELDEETLQNFNNALSFGVENRKELIPSIKDQYPGINVEDYLNNCISYQLDDEKRKGMKEFLLLSDRL